MFHLSVILATNFNICCYFAGYVYNPIYPSYNSLSPNTLQLVYLLMFNQRVEHGIFRKMQTVLKKTKHERTNEISTNRPYNVHLVAFIINLSKTV